MEKNQVFDNGVKYVEGFKKFYYLDSNKVQMDNSELLGFQKAIELNLGAKNFESWNEIPSIISKYEKDYDEFQDKKFEVDRKINEIEDVLLKNIKSNNLKANETIKSLEEQKGKLMLSKPLEMWHNRLSNYRGGKYIKIEGKDFNFKHEKVKFLDFSGKKGKIWWDKFWVIIASILDVGVIAISFWIMYYIYPESFKNTTKMSIIFSVVISTMLLGYGYLLRIFVRNWISSRHIAEEIEERISLTQFFLTLWQENKMDINKADYALIEIFKRIDNGLFKTTSSKSAGLVDRVNNYVNEVK